MISMHTNYFLPFGRVQNLQYDHANLFQPIISAHTHTHTREVRGDTQFSSTVRGAGPIKSIPPSAAQLSFQRL